MIGGLAIATAGPADAITCTHPGWSDKDPGSGTGNSSSTPVHTGPAGSCAVVATVGTAVVLHYHCYVVNSAGNTWTNVRIDGTNIDGWVWDSYLDDGGSFYHC
ncbi:MAG TPA: hypothetical protein VGX49_08710 [Jatrophihabitans sp.]|nr:hypothetical protein [Jatrophihabitans sp.]